MRQTLWLLITNSLYCGEVAHYYQKEKKSIKDGDPRLVPLHNLYAKHQYQHGYAPQNYRSPPTFQVNNYNYIFWDGHVAKTIWAHSTFIANAMDIDLEVKGWRDIFKILSKPIPNDIGKHPRINIIVVTLWVLYVMDKKLMDLNTKGIITDETIDFWPTKVKSKLEYEMTLLALITPSISHHIQTQKLHIRDQLLHSQDYFDCHNLNDDQISLYNDWWTKTTIVSITDKALNFSPFRREPP